MNKRICFAIGLSVAFSVFAKDGQNSAYFPSAHTVGERGYQIDISADYFNSTGSYDSEGVLVERTEGTSFNSTNVEGTVKYGITDGFEIRVGGRYRSNFSNDGVNELTASGVESYLGGAKYQFRTNKQFNFALDIEVRQSAFSYSKYEDSSSMPRDEIVLGDQGSEITSKMHFAYSLSDNFMISGAGGYRIPYQDLSDEIVYHLEATVMNKSNAVAVIAGARGVYSLQTSQYSDDPDARPQIYAGSTTLYNSVNRSYVIPYVGLNLSLNQFALHLNAGSVVMGSWTDAGYHAGGSIVYTGFGRSQTYKKVDKFKEYDIEGAVIKVSPRGKFVKIDQGISHDVTKDMKIDIYKSDYFGGNVLVASGVIYQVGSDWSIVKLVKKYRNINIEVGFTARGY